MPRRRQARRQRPKSYALSACNLAGRRRGRPRGCRIGATRSSASSRTVRSWTGAAVSRIASGMPRRSTTRWRLLPGSPRSVGFGPVAAPPALAGRLAASSTHRRPSISPARPSRSSRAWWNACQIPASCRSRRRRQQVMPPPQPISRGSIPQGMPLLSTKRIPVNAARSWIGGRPPFRRGGRGGSREANRDHRASQTRGAAIRPKVGSSRSCSYSRTGSVRRS